MPTVVQRSSSPSHPAMRKPSRGEQIKHTSRRKIPMKSSKPLRRRREITAPPDSDIPIPPSCSPSPPPQDATEDDTYRRGYTDEEHAFFIASIQWQLKNNPTVSKNEIIKVVADKVRL